MDNLSLLQWEKALKEMLHPECSQLMVNSILISICLKEIVFNRQPNQINWALLPGSCSAAVSVRGIWNVRPQTAQPREWWCTPAILAFRRQKQTGESRVQGYPWQHSCTEASLGYLRPCLKIRSLCYLFSLWIPVSLLTKEMVIFVF